MNTYKWSRDVALLIPNVRSACPSRSTSGKDPPVPIEQEVGWASELVWMFWKRLKSPVFAENQSGHCPACSLATVLIMLSLFPINS